MNCHVLSNKASFKVHKITCKVFRGARLFVVCMHAPKVSLRDTYIREPEFQILSALCSIVVIVSAKKNSYPRKHALNKEKSY